MRRAMHTDFSLDLTWNDRTNRQSLFNGKEKTLQKEKGKSDLDFWLDGWKSRTDGLLA